MRFDALSPLALEPRLAGLVDPLGKTRQDRAGQQPGRAVTPILPGEVAIPALPARLAPAGRRPLARQPEIGDRHDAPARTCRRAVAVGKGVELLDIAQRMVGLALDPGAQAGLQGRMIALEWTGGQQRAVLQRQHLRRVVDQRDEHRIQLDGDFVRSGAIHARSTVRRPRQRPNAGRHAPRHGQASPGYH